MRGEVFFKLKLWQLAVTAVLLGFMMAAFYKCGYREAVLRAVSGVV